MMPSDLTPVPDLPELAEPNRRFHILFTVFSVLFWLPFGAVLLIFAYLAQQAENGASGTEFIGLLLTPVIFGIGVIGLIYLIICLIISLGRRQPRPWRVASMVISVLLIGGYGLAGYMNLHQRSIADNSQKPMTRAAALALIDDCKVSSAQLAASSVGFSFTPAGSSIPSTLYAQTTASVADWGAIVAEIKAKGASCPTPIDYLDTTVTTSETSWISVDQANQLMQACKIKTFNYTASAFTDLALPTSGTPTGVILDNPLKGSINHLYIQPSEEAAVIPLARSAQKLCNGAPQIYHDNNYEQ